MMNLRMTSENVSRWLRLAVVVFALAGLASVGASAAYTISGKVTVCNSTGTGLSGVTITCTSAGQTTRTTTTIAGGTYSRGSLTDGRTYRVTPTLAGYTFAPVYRNVTAAATGIDFVATPTGSVTRSIAGRVTLCGSGLRYVVVTAGSRSATTASDGTYTITNVPMSCTPYAVTPNLAGYTFTPASQSVTVMASNITGINFTAEPTGAYSISGIITLCDGSGLGGVTVTTDTGATATTNAGGAYTITGLAGSCSGITYILTPSLAGYLFAPVTQTVTVQVANRTGINFTATPDDLTISGRVTQCDGSALSGVTLVTNMGQSATTDSGGNYTITGLTAACTTYTVTPSLTGYTFTPASQSVVIGTTSAINVNFKETPPAGTFSIAGTVSACGSGISGVTVSTDSGATATTSSTGAYTLTGLAPCTTYTVTPSKAGYTFSPGSKSVAIGASSATGVNFVAADNTLGSWDPLKQISQQQVRPNLLIVLDVSGSMAWDINGSCCPVGVDATGTSPTAVWSNGTDCSYPSTPCRTWTYTLTVTQRFPSRLATVKNALGNSVSIITPWVAPETWSTDTGHGYVTDATWAGGTISGPTVAHDATTHTYAWTVTFSTAQAAPGDPFTAYDASGKPTVGSGAVSVSPQDLVGKTADKVNWGLRTYEGTTSTSVAAIDSNDTGVVTTIENKMKLSSASGLGVGGRTPTRTALADAAGQLQSTYASDPKRTCGRTYGVILVTDGLSNNGNPGDANWISPCGACPGETCCDVGSSGYNCPDNYTAFPAGASDDLWNLTTPANARTWVIGVSNNVGPCELNYTAFKGRTDANSPNADAGFDTASDPFLSTYTIGTNHPSYAYFATTAQALNSAFTAIVAAAATGDYSTAAPVVSSAISGGTDIAYVASAGYPAWKGHFYAYDVHDPANPVLNWDAGEMLTPAKRNLTQAAKTRVIYTWDSSNTLVNLASYSAVSAIPMTLPAGFSNGVLDYLKGFDGTLSNRQRSWILGPVLNSTAAVFSVPEAWKPSSLPDHKSFETTYNQRHPLVLVGTSDGMMHVFDVADGYEIYAILPPGQLANQVLLYNNYRASNGVRVTGEPLDLPSHIYGVAASPRFADVYLTTDSQYHTVLLVTEGKGGSMMAAIDITHSYPGRTGVILPDTTSHDYGADVNCSLSGAPNYTSLISVLWSKDAGSLTGLGQTWSIPAVGATSASHFDCVLGSGYGGCSTYTPSLFSLNMQDGAARSLTGNSMTAALSPLVHNQAYGAGVLYNMTATVSKIYYVQNLGVVADANGRVWFLVPSTGAVVKAIDVGATQPIYYTPAVGYYGGKDIYAFASGNFYETSPLVTGPSATFVPRLYIVAKNADATAADPTNDIYSVALKDIEVNATTHAKLSARTQVSADPVLFIPSSTGLPVKAFFLVYDPLAGTCVGTSYLIGLEASAVSGTGWKTGVTTGVQSLGSGVASGFAFSGGKIIVAKSAIGSGRVTPQVAGEGPSPLGEAPTLSGWIELK